MADRAFFLRLTEREQQYLARLAEQYKFDASRRGTLSKMVHLVLNKEIMEEESGAAATARPA